MGCSSTGVLIDDNKRLTTDRAIYSIRSEKLETLAQDVLDDAIKMNSGTPEGIDKMLSYISSKKGGLGQLKPDEMKEALSDLYVQQLLIGEKIIKDIDIQSQVEERFINVNSFSKETKASLAILMQSFGVNYSKTQSCVCIDYDPQIHLEDPSLENSFFTNMKYNKSFQVDCLIFNLSNALLLKPSLCFNFSQIISCNCALSTVIIQLNADLQMNDQIERLNSMIQAISRHKAIQVLIIKCKSARRYSLSSAMEEALVELVRNSKTLIGLCLLKFSFSDTFLVSLEKVLPYSSSLKLLLIESHCSNQRVLDDFVGRGIGRCNSLIAVILAGFNLHEAKKNEYAQIKKGNAKLKFLEFLEEVK